MANIKKLLTEDIIPTLTDFLGDQLVFWDCFKNNQKYGTPIKSVLELGIYRMGKSELPGQSLKTLLILGDEFKVNKHISLDIDDCRSTVSICKNWVTKRGVNVTNHKFVQSNSVHFDVVLEFPDGLDFIFLDTNHDGDYPESKLGYNDSGGVGMTYREICYYADHLTENGRLVLHDTKNFYVKKAYGANTEGAVQKFLDEHSGFGFYEYNSNEHGLGEIYRVGSDVEKEHNK